MGKIGQKGVTWSPTLNIRWAMRVVDGKWNKVLQQQYISDTGGVMWQDVPVVVEE